MRGLPQEAQAPIRKERFSETLNSETYFSRMLEPDSTRKYYDLNAASYVQRTQNRVEIDLLNAFSRRLSPRAIIADLGCGSGKDLYWFRTHSKRFHPVGFDYSRPLAAHARANSGCEVIEADLRLHSFPKESLNAVWANRFFAHLNPVVCLRVLLSLFGGLQKDGLLMINFISGDHGSHFEDLTDASEGPARIFYRFSEQEFASLLMQSGFNLLEKATLAEQNEIWVTYLATRI